ncbi:right-handed parallel beta-helix repeat-containing protein [Streptomyces sp. NPDC001941]|uniref:right-handed parallel beta-helix repeat-containing protein n=1 Tax=Streptomyces sp. NPDC001941 TaxID=3154659 RepID=UPI00332B929C
MERRALMLAMGGFAGAWGAGQLAGAAPAAAAGTGGATVVDVTAHGARGDGSTDDTAAFRAALAALKAVPGGATLLVPPGTYPIGTALVLGAGCTVVAYGARVVRTGDTGALVKNFDTATPVSGYAGAGRVAVLGGVWDMRGARFSRQSDAFGFAHCDGVLVKDCTFVDVPSAHAVELNAVRNAAVVDCVFDGHHPGDGASLTTKEAVQITCATEGNLPAPAYDSTPCENVLITGCTLRAGTTTGPFGALCGDHWGAKGVFHRGIRVIGNTVEKSGAFGVRAADWQDSVIADNLIENVASHAIYLNSPQGNGLSGITVSGNTVRAVEGGGGISATVPANGARHRSLTISGNTLTSVRGEAGIYASQTDGLTVSRNTVTTTLRTAPTGNAQGIHVQNAPNALVAGNRVSDVQGDGIGVDTGSTGALVADNTVLTTTGPGINTGSDRTTVRGNRVDGATTYGVRVGGAAADTLVQGNTVTAVNAAPGSAETAAICVVAYSSGTWVVGNDLTGRGAQAQAVADHGTGTTAQQNAS